MNQITENPNSGHIKNEFSCGKEMLDNYLHRQENQNIKRKLSAWFVINDHETNLLKGYYTLANNSIPQETTPEKFKKTTKIIFFDTGTATAFKSLIIQLPY